MALLLAYGSLLADLEDAVPAVLADHGLDWGVAMDNAVRIPGYKAYVDATGAAPDVRVCFLDVVPAAGREAAGGLLDLDEADLARLDVRERNYARREVVARVGEERLPAWTYVGLPAARDRAAAGRASRSAVLVASYLERVRAARTGLGLATPEVPAGVAVRALERREL